MSLKVWLPLDGSLRNLGYQKINAVGSNLTEDTNGKIGKCYNFNTSYIDITPALLNNDTQEFSFAAWFYLDALTSSTLFCNRVNTNSYGFAIFIMNNGHIYFDTGGRWDYTPDDNHAIVAQKWYHIVCTYKRGVGRSIYLNGEHLATSATGAEPTEANASITIIGTAQTHTGNPFRGKLNDVRIYDHCLSREEICDLAKGLILHYKLNDCSAPNLFSTNPSLTMTVSSTGTAVYSSYVYLNPAVKANNLLKPNTVYTVEYDYIVNVNSTENTAFIYSQLNTSRSAPIVAQKVLDVAGATGHIVETFTVTAAQAAYSSTFHMRWRINSASSNTSATISNMRLYLGAPTNTTSVIDSSGYGHHGSIVNNVIYNNNSARYNTCSFSADGTLGYIQTPALNMPTDAITMNIWFKSANTTPTGSYHILVDSIGSSTRRQDYEMAIYKTGYLRAGLRVNNTRYVDNCSSFLDGCNDQWHMFTISYDGAIIKRYCDGVLKKSTTIAASTGLYPTATLRLFRDGYSEIACINASLSDFRIYSTALLDSEIKKLYNVGMGIDEIATLHTYEVNEISTISVLHNIGVIDGQINEALYCPYDPEIYIEPDGSKWVHIFHHNNPLNALFEATDTFQTSVYKDEDRWFYISLCNQITSWELMIKSTRTENDTIYTRRWTQLANPMIATAAEVTAALITQNTNGYANSTFGGLYKRSANTNTYLNIHDGSATHWYGAIGCFTAWSSNNASTGIISTAKADGITTGYVDVYVRIDNTTFTNMALHNEIHWLTNQLIER